MARTMRSSASSPQRTETSGPVSDEDVARIAYELFQRRGGVHGHDQEDWLEAERIVRERKLKQQG